MDRGRARQASPRLQGNAAPGRVILCALAALALPVGGCKTKQTEFPTVDRMTAGIFLDPAGRAVLPPGVVLRPVSDEGLELTKASEGFRGTLYNDAAGYCTIAFGHLIKLARCDGTESPELLDGVTKDEGTRLLVEDMSAAQTTVMVAVEANLTDSQYAALCDFVFNVGSGNFRRSTLLKVVNREVFENVPHELRRWVKAGGRVLPGLVTRRENEVELFFDGLPIPRAAPPAGLELEPIDIRKGEGAQE